MRELLNTLTDTVTVLQSITQLHIALRSESRPIQNGYARAVRPRVAALYATARAASGPCSDHFN